MDAEEKWKGSVLDYGLNRGPEGMTRLSSIPRERCQALRPSDPNRSIMDVSVMEATFPRVWRPNLCRATFKVGGYGEQVYGVRG